MAFLSVLCTSLDDIMWLLPYFAKPNLRHGTIMAYSAIFIFGMQCVVFTSFAISLLGRKLISKVR